MSRLLHVLHSSSDAAREHNESKQDSDEGLHGLLFDLGYVNMKDLANQKKKIF